jgi:hypothetical protein
VANVVVIKPGERTLFTGLGVYSEQKLQADAEFFDAWHGAIEMSNAVFSNTHSGNWIQSSLAADYISPEKRLDPWNHAFCLLRRDNTLAVISAGPMAPSSPVCKNIQITAEELGKLPHMKLMQSPAGFLFLVAELQDQR